MEQTDPANIKRARELVSDPERYDAMIQDVEVTVRAMAAEHDLEVGPDSVEAIQAYMAWVIADSADRTADDWLDRLYREMKEPDREQARSNVMAALGAAAVENTTLRRLAGAKLAAERGQGGGS